MTKIDRYEVGSELGTNGAGKIVAVTGPTGTLRGLLIERSRVSNPEALVSMGRRLTGALGPGLVRILDIVDDDAHWLVVSALAGRPLSELVREGQVDGPGAIAILDDVAAGIIQLRQWNIVQAALTPDSVLVDGEGVGRIADAGVQSAIDGGAPAPDADGAAFAALAWTLAMVADPDSKSAIEKAAVRAQKGDIVAARSQLTGKGRRISVAVVNSAVATVVEPAAPVEDVGATVIDLPTPPMDVGATVLDMPGVNPDATVLDMPPASADAGATMMDLPVPAALQHPPAPAAPPPAPAPISADAGATLMEGSGTSADMGATLLEDPGNVPTPTAAAPPVAAIAASAASDVAPSAAAIVAAAVAANRPAGAPEAPAMKKPKGRLRWIIALVVAAVLAFGAWLLLHPATTLTVQGATLVSSRPVVRCGTPVDFVATVTTTGTGSLTYQWELLDGSVVKTDTPPLSISGSQTSSTITLHDHLSGHQLPQRKLLLHILTPTNIKSPAASYTYSC